MKPNPNPRYHASSGVSTVDIATNSRWVKSATNFLEINPNFEKDG
jgi:hypothetical protein